MSLGACYAACSVKSHDYIGGGVYGAGKVAAHFSGDGNQPQGGVLLKMLCPLFVKAIAAFSHFVQILVRFLALIQPGIEDGDAEHHKQLML